ncbi:MAG: recombinase family protein [Gemmataceae bacterium]
MTDGTNSDTTKPAPGRCLVYGCDLSAPGEADAQIKAARAFCEKAGLTVTEAFTDQGGAWYRAMSSRPAGYRLLMAADPGDTVVFGSARAIGPRTADADVVLRRLRRLRVAVHVADEAAAGQPGKGLEALVRLDRATKSAEIKAGMDRLKKEGRRSSRFPQLGHRFVWKEGGWKTEPDPYEMGVIEKIVEWKNAGVSWNAIAEHLLAQGVKTTSGGDWHPRRLQVVYQRVREGLLPLEANG